MKANYMKQVNLESVLLEFYIEAGGGPKPAILEVYCRKYPQYARELTDYALEWLIDEAMAPTEAERDVAANEPAGEFADGHAEGFTCAECLGIRHHNGDAEPIR